MKADRAEEDAIEFVEPPVPPEQAVRGLVKTHRTAVHEMTRDQYKRHREPGRCAALQNRSQRDLGAEKKSDHDLKRRAAHPVRLVKSGCRLRCLRGVHRSAVISAEVRISGERHTPVSTARYMRPRF